MPKVVEEQSRERIQRLVDLAIRFLDMDLQELDWGEVIAQKATERLICLPRVGGQEVPK